MISVIIAVHNEELNIIQCLHSVYDQDVNMEVLMVDDLSTDRTIPIVKEYFPDVRIIELKDFYPFEQATGSPNWGRNLGVKLAMGEYIAFLDADDRWLPGKLRLQMESIEKYKVPISCTGFSKEGKLVSCGIGTTLIPNPFYLLISRNKKFYPQYSTLLFEKKIYPPMETEWGLYDMAWKFKLFEGRECVRVGELLLEKNSARTSENPIVREVLHYETNLALAHYAVKYPEYADTCYKSIKTYWGTMARWYYHRGKYKQARYYMTMSRLTVKNLLYYMTSYTPIVAKKITCRVHNH